MYMDEGMDTGDMILTQEVEIDENETTGDLWNKLSIIGSNLLVKTINEIINNTAPRIKQGEDFSMAPMLKKEMSKINWNEKKSTEIKNLVRGLNPIMGAYSFVDNKKIKFWKIDIIKEEDFQTIGINKDYIKEYKPGTVVYVNEKKGLYIKTLDGVISVLEIQGENSKKMNILDFLRGNKIENNVTFV